MEPNQSAPSLGRRPGFCIDPRFINLRHIGHGGNAMVYSATDSDCDKEVAIKKLCFSDRRGCKYALRELKLMRRLQHENVVTVYEVLGSNGFSLEKGGNVNLNLNETSSVYIVQELLHTDLHQLIQQQQLTEEHVRLFTYQLLRGLKYIHSANVVHRDLKPMNLLINVEDLVLKIADFGLARVVDTDYSHKGFLTDNVGTCWYRSPELIISPREYTKAIDLWSVGCILAEMLTGRPVFPGAHEMDQIGLILDSVYLSDNEWNTVTQILPQSFIRRHTPLDLLEKLLVFEAGLRMTAEEALAHPYLQQFACVEDEPIVLTPFHIEHEVDDLSPKTARRMISNEMSKTIETCGSQVETAPHLPVDESCDMPSPDALTSQSAISTSSQEPRAVNISIQRECQQDKNKYMPNNDTMNAEKNRRVASPLIEDWHEDADNSRRNGRNDVRAKQAQGFHSQTITPYSDIDLIPLEAVSLESQLKNLRVIVDLPDEENMKEQISPKENKDEGTEKSKHSKDLENASMERLVVKVDTIQAKFKVPKTNDIVNQERQGEPARPRDNSDFDEIDFIRLEKERMRQLGLTEKFKNGRKKKKNRRNTRSNSGEDRQDFDSLYRLPTEHLTRHRNSISGKDRNVRSVEEQLRLHEEWNERRKLVEMEREHNYGAVGGFPETEEGIVTQEQAVTFEGGNTSPTSEHSRDSSPTNEDVNIRRFDR
ncbi:MK06-like protein [Mya arenaria]|uniref:MK06-like protein n=1 Tax=Mya arenaria TaxID=6604 RepID=A0ABY7DWC8_MYAAR|nr:MK06-like protein [Mya arenaria]